MNISADEILNRQLFPMIFNSINKKYEDKNCHYFLRLKVNLSLLEYVAKIAEQQIPLGDMYCIILSFYMICVIFVQEIYLCSKLMRNYFIFKIKIVS